MTDLVIYFIGACDTLFNFVSSEWRDSLDLKLAFVIIVGALTAITLTCALTAVKSALIALVQSIRGAG